MELFCRVVLAYRLHFVDMCVCLPIQSTVVVNAAIAAAKLLNDDECLILISKPFACYAFVSLAIAMLDAFALST